MKKITFAFLFFSIATFFAQTPQDFFPTSNYDGTQFGRQVEISNNQFLVSSSNSPLQTGGSGKVYLFNFIGNTPQQINAFYPEDALVTDNFGASISFQNDFIAIGSPYHDENFDNSGAVYLYKKTNETWQLLQKITASDGDTNDNFGSFVKIHNNQLFISAINDDYVSNSGENNGSVYVYDFNGNSWVFSSKITLPGSLRFGSKIEAEDNKIVISSYENETNGIYFAIYSFDDVNWTMTDLTPTIGNLEEIIQDFSLSNNRLFLVASVLNSNSKVYILDPINNLWGFTSFINLTEFPDQIYTKIEVSAETMLLGSTSYFLQIERKFPLLIYKKINNIWTSLSSIYGFGPDAQDDHFGASIALNGNFALVGAPEEGIAYSTGKAYYFDTTLNVDKFKKSSVELYPNPSSDFVFIKNNSDKNLLSSEIYSITGSLLLTQKSSLEQLSLANLPVGMYFVKLNFSENITETYKIIKK